MGRTSVLVIITVLVGLSLAALESGVVAMERSGFGVSVMTDKVTYAVGDTIAMTLRVFDYTEEEVTFHFRTGQRFDFVIEDERGNKVWRWSDDKFFTMVLGKEVLGPGNEELIYKAEFKGELGPGNYKITGILVDQPIPISANIAVSVSNPQRP